VQEFREWLTARLIELGLSKADLNRASDVGDSNISRWLTGGRRPTPANLEKIAPVLGVSYEDLMRMCGYLPGAPTAVGATDPDETEMLALFRQVPDERRGAAKMMLRGLAVQRTRPVANRRQIAEANRKNGTVLKMQSVQDEGDDQAAKRGLPPWYSRLLRPFASRHPWLPSTEWVS
jgi:transcriptional regulator with XRE-family HTH domain